MKYYVLTDQGRVRTQNQDYLYSTDQPVGPLPNLFLVADGMGGHNAGEYASEHTVKLVLDEVRGAARELSPVATLEQAITHANQMIYERAVCDVEKSGMGTTLVAATFVDGHLFVANVGDSRLYVNSIDELKQITRDHSLVEELVREGTVSKMAAKNHPKKHMITRAVGAEESVQVDFFDLDLEETDQILLCTDGLTNMLEDSEIRSILLGEDTLQNKVHTLVDRANENGGNDNITVLLVEPFSNNEVNEC